MKKWSAIVFSVFTLMFAVQRPVNVAFADETRYAKAECVMEMQSRRILYEESGDLRLPMASTTKIVTLLTVLNECKTIDESVEIPKQAEGVEGSSVYLKAGDKYTVRELLYGLMLRSGNDCATALAWHISGGNAGFCVKMQETAQRAGALDSAFKNPHGLPCDGHYTTARDLTKIACLGMQNETFREIVGTKYFQARGWKNKNKILSLCEGGNGVKTGYTMQAGRCLVASATRKGMTLVCTVLSCPTMFERATSLLDDAFSAYDNKIVVEKNGVYEWEKDGKRYKARALYERRYPMRDGEKNFLSYTIKPLEKSQKDETGREILAVLEIRLAKHLLFLEKLYKL